jgi:hypothetical protein
MEPIRLRERMYEDVVGAVESGTDFTEKQLLLLDELIELDKDRIDRLLYFRWQSFRGR